MAGMFGGGEAASTLVVAFGLSCVGAAVESSWAAGESTVQPYLIFLGVLPSYATLIWLANPMLGLAMTLVASARNDKQGDVADGDDNKSSNNNDGNGLEHFANSAGDRARSREKKIKGMRRQFGARTLTLLGLFALGLGGQLLLASSYTFRKAAAAAFIAYAVTDAAHDAMLVVARAQLMSLVDVSRLSSQSVNAMLSVVQMMGRCVALAMGTFSIEKTIPAWVKSYIGSCHDERCEHMQALILYASAFLCVCYIAYVAAAIGVYRSLLSSDDEERTYLMEKKQPLQAKERQASSASAWSIFIAHSSIICLACIQFSGWIGLMASLFFWTIWIGEEETTAFFGVKLRTAFLGLAVQSAMSLGTAIALPALNRLGTRTVYFAFETLFGFLLVALYLMGPRWSVAISFFLGPCYAVHVNNPFVLLSSLSAQQGGIFRQRRDTIVAIVSAAMPVAQVIVAVASGYIVSAFGNDYSVIMGISGLLVVATMAMTLPFARRWLPNPTGTAVAVVFSR